MKHISIFLFVCLIALPLYSFAEKAPIAVDKLPLKESPLAQLDSLIDSTEQLVLKQKALRDQLQEYIKWRDAYLKDTENRELVLKAAKLANQALEAIKAERLTSLFDASFLSEMTLFAKLAQRPSLPKTPT